MIAALAEESDKNSSLPAGKGKTPKLPASLTYPNKELEILKARIKVFWTLRQMILQLTEEYSLSNQLMKVNPFFPKNILIESWKEG
jgi:hypothetical protein